MDKPWGRNNGKINSRELLRQKPPLIATGEWEDTQCYYFTGEDERGMKIGDIVMVREGATPLALCKIISDCFKDDKLMSKYHHTFFRNVKILDWFSGDSKFPQPQGTVQRLTDAETASWEFIDGWYSKFINELQMKDKIEVLKAKGQIILQGPPGTGKTREAKIIANYLTSNNHNDISALTNEDIKEILRLNIEIKSVAGNATYIVKVIDNEKVTLCFRANPFA